MNSGQKPKPFAPLGAQLKAIRQRTNETIAEVSGAVEIDALELANFEIGRERPSQEILILLISHFGVKDDEAVKLWQLAGYQQDKVVNDEIESENIKHSVAVFPADARIVYTDMVHVMVNNYGVVMNFMQGAGPGTQPLAVSRIGMSREHAQSVLDVLRATLENSTEISQKQPKKLNPPEAS